MANPTGGPSADANATHASFFSERCFWDKLAKFGLTAGRELVVKVLTLYYAALDPDTPTWAKAIIVGALGYFIMPLDAIPDIIPIAGFSDDLASVAMAMGTVLPYIKTEHAEKARSLLGRWFPTT